MGALLTPSDWQFTINGHTWNLKPSLDKNCYIVDNNEFLRYVCIGKIICFQRSFIIAVVFIVKRLSLCVAGAFYNLQIDLSAGGFNYLMSANICRSKC